MAIQFYTPMEVAEHIAKRCKEKRLQLNLSQNTLAMRADVSLAVLKKFESTGKVSLLSLLKLALVLESLPEFEALFQSKTPESFLSLDQLLQKATRKRGRK